MQIETIMQNPALEPVNLGQAGQPLGLLKIDAIFRDGDLCAIGGWMSENLQIRMASNKQEFASLFQARFLRPDVNEYLQTDPGLEHGFAVVFRSMEQPELLLSVGDAACLVPLDLTDAASEFNAAALGAAACNYLKPLLTSVRQWQLELGQDTPYNIGIDCVLRWPADGAPIVVTGWSTLPADVQFLAGNEAGAKAPEDIQYFTRPDIANAFDAGLQSQRQGFVFTLRDWPENTLSFYAEKTGAKLKLATQKVKICFSYRKFLQELFAITFPLSEIIAIYRKVFLPLLGPIQLARSMAASSASPVVETLGYLPANPQYSLIIPLYGTLKDLPEQMGRLALDQTVAAEAEIIYVIDNLSLLDEFRITSRKLYASLGLPCRFAYLNFSQGFGGASNLGAAIARGQHLVFMNSDVYPQSAGFLQKFANCLSHNPDVGIAGCSLVFPDGSPQHCGAYLAMDDALDIPQCIHFLQNRASKPYEVPYVTAACMAMSKADFQNVGGFSPEYIIGNFEDLDLCEKIRRKGKKICYLPKLSMIHHWHHSFQSLEQGHWLDHCAYYNAIVFADKFQDSLTGGREFLYQQK